MTVPDFFELFLEELKTNKTLWYYYKFLSDPKRLGFRKAYFCQRLEYIRHMIGAPGQGWALAMTVVSHEREPGELGYVARYAKTVHQLERAVEFDPGSFTARQREAVAWAHVETEMLRLHVCRRLSERLDGIEHGPGGSVDKLLMTWTEQTVGSTALEVAGADAVTADDVALRTYLYSRAQSVMGGTSQIQKNIVATRILGLPTD